LGGVDQKDPCTARELNRLPFVGEPCISTAQGSEFPPENMGGLGI
jgi:hypothetical protein